MLAATTWIKPQINYELDDKGVKALSLVESQGTALTGLWFGSCHFIFKVNESFSFFLCELHVLKSALCGGLRMSVALLFQYNRNPQNRH